MYKKFNFSKKCLGKKKFLSKKKKTLIEIMGNRREQNKKKVQLKKSNAAMVCRLENLKIHLEKILIKKYEDLT